MKESIKKIIDIHQIALQSLNAQIDMIENIAQLCIESLEDQGKIIFMGNGGSAADAQHFAAELVGRFKVNRLPLASIALTTDTSIITAVANDFGYENIFLRQVQALANPGDVIIGISTSGKSKNIIKAIEFAKTKTINTVGLLGKDGGDLKKLVDIALTINCDQTPQIQEMHSLAGHIICEIIENHFAI